MDKLEMAAMEEEAAAALERALMLPLILCKADREDLAAAEEEGALTNQV